MAKFRIWGMIDIEVDAESEEEALATFEVGLDDVVSSCIDIELIEED